MRSRIEIWLTALEELGALCSVNTAQDRKTVLRRAKGEGDAFFTVTLPSYARDFERSLALGSIPGDMYVGFSRERASLSGFTGDVDTLPLGSSYVGVAGVPKFLGGFQNLLFHVGAGNHTNDIHADEFWMPVLRPYSEEQADAVFAIRQLCRMFGKEKAISPPEKVGEALRKYVQTDLELEEPLASVAWSSSLFGDWLPALRKVFNLMYADVLSELDREIYEFELHPRHGPGATADRLKGNQKWRFQEWPLKLEAMFPFGEYAIPNWRYYWKLNQVKFLVPGEERPVRVIPVPKTQTEPRLIAIEPTAMQYVQQAVGRPLMRLLESRYIAKNSRENLAFGFLGFEEQWPNQAMACIGSEDGSLATLDLSEASDRVANWLVEDLFANYPHVNEGLQACRSTHASLPPDGSSPDKKNVVHSLRKFASMGSALTFPIEAMIFGSIAMLGCLEADGLPATRSNIKLYRDKVRVYGDDIIVPTYATETVIDWLERFAFKVNRHKSFWTGMFRESCGKEYWNGNDVSVVKFRTNFPSSLHDVTEVISTVATRNQLYKAGLLGTAEFLDSGLEKILNGHYPIVAETSPVIGRVDDYISYEYTNIDKDTYAPLVRGYVVKAKNPINRIDDLDALLKCLIEATGSESVDSEHLTRSGRPRAVRLKLVMASPF